MRRHTHTHNRGKSLIARPIKGGFEYGSLDLISYTHTKPHAHTTLITTAWLSSLEPNRENGCVFTLSAVSSPDGPVEQASGSLICCQQVSLEVRLAYLTSTW